VSAFKCCDPALDGIADGASEPNARTVSAATIRAKLLPQGPARPPYGWPSFWWLAHYRASPPSAPSIPLRARERARHLRSAGDERWAPSGSATAISPILSNPLYP
jgi:hypothetical protein